MFPLIGGCSSGEEKVNIKAIQGEIVTIDDNSMVISDGVNQVDLKYTNHTAFEGKEPNELVVGDKVKTWYSSQPLESNSVQVTASKIEFIEE